MATLIYRRTTQVHMDKLDEAMRITTEQAKIFKELGGHVIYFGKPYPDIYNFCIQKNERVLAIGDNIRTDIKGANNMKFDSLFIINGVHKNEFIKMPPESYDKILNSYE